MDSLHIVEALGIEVGLDLSAHDAESRRAVRRAWAGASLRAASDSGLPRVGVAVEAGAIDGALANLSAQVTRAVLRARRGDLWMLHAGGVADDSGAVAVLVGPSGMGKTTSMRALGTRYGYVSDETIGIAPDGRILPYRKPLSIVRPGASKAQHAPSELGLRGLPAGELRMGPLLVLDRRADGPAAPRLHPLDLAAALDALLPQTSFLTAMTEPLATIARHIERAGGVYRLDYREAESIVDVVGELFAELRPMSEPLTSAPMRADGGASGGTIARRDHLDARLVAASGDLIVLRGEPGGEGRMTVLAGVAPRVWEAADGSSLEAIAAHVERVHGPHPARPTAEAVAEVIDELVGEGLLVRDRVVWSVGAETAWTGGPHRVTVVALDDADAAPRIVEGSGAVIWTLLSESGPMPVDALVAAVADAYGESTESVAAAVESFLRELERAGLVDRDPDAARDPGPGRDRRVSVVDSVTTR